MKVLTLISTGLGRLNRDEEALDFAPRASLFKETTHSDLLNEEALQTAPPWRRWIYKRLPVVPAQAIEAYFRRKQYDVIISWSDSHALLFALLLKITGRRFPHLALMFWISKPKKARLLKFVHSHIDTIVLWTSAHREFAINKLGISPEKIRFIPYYVDQKFWRPMPNVATDMICSAGVEMRDYPTLMKAMADLPGIECHIAAGTARGMLFSTVTAIYEHEIPKNISVGKMSFAELRDLYARSRFVVVPLLPTDSDNGLTVILEAMAMGKAVICSKTYGQRDVIKDGVTGMFVPQGNPAALREAIDYLWKNPDGAERMGREGRKLIEERHTWDQFVNNVKTFAEETARGSHPSSLIQQPQAAIENHATRASIPS
jgi:glycosyltransferase involved in cell wall biosynthesis